MDFTGERMIPGATSVQTYWEHIYRYRFATTMAHGKDVLDIACGEGYGTHALSVAGAKSVVGIDISQEAVDNAKEKYGVDARIGKAEAIPLPESSIDLVVSFETIEHVDEPQRFVEEVARVLRKGGTFLVSTPDKNVYRKDDKPNEFHVSEMTIAELNDLLVSHFSEIQYFSQTIHSTGRGRLYRYCRRKLCGALRRLVFRWHEWERIPSSDGTLEDILRPTSISQRVINPYIVRTRGEKDVADYIVACAIR